jgi:hypothetical protein
MILKINQKKINLINFDEATKIKINFQKNEIFLKKIKKIRTKILM